MSRRLIQLITLAAFCGIYAFATGKLASLPRVSLPQDIAVAIPPLAQVPLALGDRYLAANIETARAMMVGANVQDAATYKVLADVQRGAAALNPAHEDNYYIAEAVLPWNGQGEANQQIQELATNARTWDYLPPFFVGFNRFYFSQDPVGGAMAVNTAAQRSPPGNREALTAMAGKWYEKGDDPQTAIGLINGLISSTRNVQLQQHLRLRVERLKGLITLRQAATRYLVSIGKPPEELADLQKAGLLSALPVDPFGLGYKVGPTGVPELISPKPQKTKPQQ